MSRRTQWTVLVGLTAVALVLLVSRQSASPVADSQPFGFRDLRFGTPKKDIPELAAAPDLQACERGAYQRPADSLRLDSDTVAAGILYCFDAEDRLQKVWIYMDDANRFNDVSAQELSKRYGPFKKDEKNGKPSWTWASSTGVVIAHEHMILFRR